MSYYRRNENRPVLTGRAARRQVSRVEARAAVRELCATRAAKPSAPTWTIEAKDKDTDRRRRVYNSPRVLNHHGRAMIAYANADSEDYLLARDYLRALGCDDPFIASFESWFGRHTTEQFRINHGFDPDNGHRMFINGRMRHVNRYRDANDLRNGAVAYGRTRHLVTVETSRQSNQLVNA